MLAAFLHPFASAKPQLAGASMTCSNTSSASIGNARRASRERDFRSTKKKPQAGVPGAEAMKTAMENLNHDNSTRSPRLASAI